MHRERRRGREGKTECGEKMIKKKEVDRGKIN